MHDVDMSLELKLDLWRKDALIRVVCEKCFGSGEDKYNQGRACPTCEGSGRAPHLPHVIELVDLVRKQQKVIQDLQSKTDEDAWQDAFRKGVEAMRHACKQALFTSYDAGAVNVVDKVEVGE